MKPACHAITWGRNLAGALSEIRALGFLGFESFGPEMYGGETEFRRLAGEANLQVASIYSGGSLIYPEKADIEIAAITKTAALLASLGSRELVVGGGHKRPEGNTPEDYETMARALNHIGAIAQEHSLRACFHPHSGTCVETGPQIDLLMALTDPKLVYLCPDTGHLVMGDADPLACIEKYFTRIGYVHLKDLDDANRSVELGRGKVDLAAILKALQTRGYDGWLTVELDASLTTPRQSAEISLQFLRKHGVAK